MRNILLFVVFAIAGCWAVPKPMESVANYNILMVHGAYGSDKGIKANTGLKEADSTSELNNPSAKPKMITAKTTAANLIATFFLSSPKTISSTVKTRNTPKHIANR